MIHRPVTSALFFFLLLFVPASALAAPPKKVDVVTKRKQAQKAKKPLVRRLRGTKVRLSLRKCQPATSRICKDPVLRRLQTRLPKGWTLSFARPHLLRIVRQGYVWVAPKHEGKASRGHASHKHGVSPVHIEAIARQSLKALAKKRKRFGKLSVAEQARQRDWRARLAAYQQRRVALRSLRRQAKRTPADKALQHKIEALHDAISRKVSLQLVIAQRKWQGIPRYCTPSLGIRSIFFLPTTEHLRIVYPDGLEQEKAMVHKLLLSFLGRTSRDKGCLLPR